MGSSEASDLIGEVDHAIEAGELRAVLQRTQRQLARAKAKTEDLVAAVYQAAHDAAVALGPAPAVPKPAADRRKGRAEFALVHATDWQIGKANPTYNVEVAQRRVAQIGTKVVRLTEIQRSARPIRECHLLLGGDMLEGVQIFAGQVFELDATLFAQLFATARCIEGLARALCATFETVHVWEVSGNHGRLGRRGDYPHSDNADTIAYRIAADRCAGEPRIIWHPSASWYTIATIGARYRALLVHGDQIKSFGGNTPAYGITRKALGWSAGVLEEWTDLYLGHFHQYMTLPLANGFGSVYMSGTIESGNEFAREFCAATGVPSQRLHFIDGDKGRVTSEHRLYLD